MLPDLAADALYLFVFGPGFGELVAVRAPPDDWLIVDGCSWRGASYGLALVEHYDARPRAIVLTHPHLDHARGAGDVIDAATAGLTPEEWPLIGLVLPSWVRGAGDLADLGRAYQGGVAEEAIAAILDRWEREPRCRWTLERGDVRTLGEAKVIVASPSPDARLDAERRSAEGRRVDPNKIASVLLVEWADHRVVLGSDLVDDAPEGWAAALATVPCLAAPTVLKVAHHGSLPAQHRELVPAAAGTLLVATPFASLRLPRFEDGEGAHMLLEREPELLLTGLPRAHAEQGVHPTSATRAELAAAGRGGRREPPVAGFPDCCSVIELRPGVSPRRIMGPGSIVVLR